jgi:hypothetical protein
VGAPSTSVPGNAPENLMMVPESLLAFVDEAKMTGQLENPKRRF